jgi:hypothetical protein
MRIDLGDDSGDNYFIKAFGNFTMRAKTTSADSDGNPAGGTITFTSEANEHPFEVVNGNKATHKFYVDWGGNICAMGGSIGGWSIYQGDGTPPDPKSPTGNWNILYTTDGTYYMILDATRDNVIAAGISRDKLWTNHNSPLYDKNGGAKFTVMKDGSVYATAGSIAGWYLTPTSF